MLPNTFGKHDLHPFGYQEKLFVLTKPLQKERCAVSGPEISPTLLRDFFSHRLFIREQTSCRSYSDLEFGNSEAIWVFTSYIKGLSQPAREKGRDLAQA